jgi:Protein of unknown function (DUF732)
MKEVAALSIATCLLLSGCSGSAEQPTPPAAPSSTTTASPPTSSTSTTTTQPPGPTAFVSWAKNADMGNKDFSKATDDQLLSIGNQACDVISTSKSFGQAVQDLTAALKSAEVTADQNSQLLRQAVVNLCPQHKPMLP